MKHLQTTNNIEPTELLLEYETGLEAYEDCTEIATAPNKNVSVVKDDRYTTIYIDSKRENEKVVDQYADCYMKIKITKDRILDTTETHIQKFFVCDQDKTSDEVDVILRDIFVDRARGKSKRDAKSARVKMTRMELMEVLRSNDFVNEHEKEEQLLIAV